MAQKARTLLRTWLAVFTSAFLVFPAATSAQQSPQPPDADGDGVPDTSDACPKEPGVKSSDPKTSGCAAKVDAGKVKDKAEITFFGYETLPGNRGVIFVELTNPVAVEVSRSGQVIEYKLVGATVPLKNNKNPLLLGDFSVAAVTAQLIPDKVEKRRRKKGKAVEASRAPGVRLVITLRSGATGAPSHRIVARGTGAALEVELPLLPAAATR
jgi:hypothetical protein